jgi:AcrR family transcriptional regulator
MPTRGEATRTKLLDTAERLFAERGIDAVSLREINEAAQQGNTAALHYHFGSRDALLSEILARHMPAFRSRREELLTRAEARGALVTLRDVAEAVVMPVADAVLSGASGLAFARIAEQVLSDPSRSAAELADLFGASTAERTAALLQAWCADLPPAVMQARLTLAVSTIVHALADRARLTMPPRRRRLPSQRLFVSNLVDVVAAMLIAPVSDETRATLE